MNEKIESLIKELAGECKKENLNLVVGVSENGEDGNVFNTVVGPAKEVVINLLSLENEIENEVGRPIEIIKMVVMSGVLDGDEE